MRLLSTSTCCCCADLRTGGVILGFLVLFGSLLNFCVIGSKGIFVCVVTILIWGAWLYGIFNQKTSFMLPALIVTIIGLFSSLIVLILLPILGSVYGEDVQSYLNKLAEQEHKEPLNGTTFMSTLWLIIALAAAIQWHFSAVMFSLYKQVKENLQNSGIISGA